MSDTYEIDDFDRVVPYSGGRRSNDTRTYRDATELELEQREEIESLQSQVQSLEQERERLTNAIKHIHWSMGDELLDREQITEHICSLCDQALQTTPADSNA